MCVGGVCYGTGGDQRISCSYFSSTKWVSGIDLRFLCLVAGTFTDWAILPVLRKVFTMLFHMSEGLLLEDFFDTTLKGPYQEERLSSVACHRPSLALMVSLPKESRDWALCSTPVVTTHRLAHRRVQVPCSLGHLLKGQKVWRIPNFSNP